jgi:hypothetical protein
LEVRTRSRVCQQWLEPMRLMLRMSVAMPRVQRRLRRDGNAVLGLQVYLRFLCLDS